MKHEGENVAGNIGELIKDSQKLLIESISQIEEIIRRNESSKQLDDRESPLLFPHGINHIALTVSNSVLGSVSITISGERGSQEVHLAPHEVEEASLVSAIVEIPAGAIKKIRECMKREALAVVDKTKIDCADVAIMSFAKCAIGQGYKVDIPVYDSATSKYIVLRSIDYNDADAYIKDLRNKVGAINLWDQGKVTRARPYLDLIEGDLVLYDIPNHAPAYTGHTMVVVENDKALRRVIVVEGHLDEFPEKNQYSYEQLDGKWNGPLERKGRIWNWEKLLS